MNYPSYSNDPNDPHSQDTVAGQPAPWPQPGQQPQQPPQQPQWGQSPYPQWGQQAPPHPQLPPPGQNFPPFSQQYPPPGQFGPPPNPQQLTAKPPLRLRFRAMPRWKRFGTIGCSTIIATIMLCSLCAVVGNALPKAPQQSSTIAVAQPSPTAYQVARIVPTLAPTATLTPEPTATPTPSPTPVPTPTPTPTPTPVPVPPVQQQAPVQQPAPPPPAPPSGVNGNPWGYDFNPGNYIYSTPAAFCTYFSCINNFENGTGYVEECSDGMYSRSGGRSGSCSHHGGNWRPLYSH